MQTSQKNYLDYLEKEYPSSGYDAFMSDLRRIANSTIQGDCSDVVFDPLYSLFVRDIYEKSAILHFTDAVAKDTSGWRQLTEANSRRNLPVNENCYSNQKILDLHIFLPSEWLQL